MATHDKHPSSNIPKELWEQWNTIDEYAMAHLHPVDRGNNASVQSSLDKTLAATKEAKMPLGNVSPAWGKFLTLQARAIKAKHALEVGTLAGYSAIWMASQVPGLKLDTIEYLAKHAEVAQRNIDAAGVADQVTLHQGAALDVLASFEEGVLKGLRERFDFVFIDADKLNSAAYFDYAVRLSRPGSIIIVDNVMGRFGVSVAETDPQEEHAKGGKLAIEAVGKDTRVDATVMQFVGAKGYDGYLLALVL
ncbi:O-methyltransferase-like protein family 3 [Dactylonectria macrodidyma]|uniref:O-methyltransferase-like protein family 3 n=1 Tax=Dactylonectria macrodidyma TaxID=307937 RepID=A0A9P9F6Y8_9HYPO|nr:O-methyltransferase-like protein family 3 [Dactylonectria macrodidyma]